MGEGNANIAWTPSPSTVRQFIWGEAQSYYE
jgi:hypothetical protein